MAVRADGIGDVRHAPPVVGSLLIAGKPLPVINCANYRHDGTAMSCAAGHQAGMAQCFSCQHRMPLMAVTMDAVRRIEVNRPRRIRGLGDLVEACIRVLFLGRLDIAHRLAAKVERLIPSRRRPVPQQGKAGGCGCKARKEALNRAIPFGTTNANRLHQHDGFPAGSPGQDHQHGQGSAVAAGKHPHEH